MVKQSFKRFWCRLKNCSFIITSSLLDRLQLETSQNKTPRNQLKKIKNHGTFPVLFNATKNYMWLEYFALHY